jgi:aconitate hydratase
VSVNSFGARNELRVGEQQYNIFRLDSVDGAARLPYSLKILLENLLRTEDGANVTADHVRALAGWDPSAEPGDPVHSGPRTHAGLHRCARGRRPCDHAGSGP